MFDRLLKGAFPLVASQCNESNNWQDFLILF